VPSRRTSSTGKDHDYRSQCRTGSHLYEGIDLVFIDAKKRDYIAYYEAVIDKVVSGGLLLADNILWDGKVLDSNPDKTTQAIKEFNAHIAVDLRVDSVILPLRDGVNVIMKR